MPEIYILYSTFVNPDEALTVAKALIDKHLIACANIHKSAVSLYRWEGSVQQTEEATLVAKTQKNKLQAAIAEIKRLHSYEVPCIVAYPIADGFQPFLEWVKEETR